MVATSAARTWTTGTSSWRVCGPLGVSEVVHGDEEADWPTKGAARDWPGWRRRARRCWCSTSAVDRPSSSLGSGTLPPSVHSPRSPCRVGPPQSDSSRPIGSRCGPGAVRSAEIGRPAELDTAALSCAVPHAGGRRGLAAPLRRWLSTCRGTTGTLHLVRLPRPDGPRSARPVAGYDRRERLASRRCIRAAPT